MRYVAHVTKGKLDLRAITIFGMNSKPETTTPIGYFGTGLKYAVAVLARENIPIKIIIDKKVWSIVKQDTEFRDKHFAELYLVTPGIIKNRTIKLPFTTELGKNWKLWQAFRELHSNTLDEKGATDLCTEPLETLKNHTYIIVEGESYVQEYLERGKTFLEEGLTERSIDSSVQILDKPSQHVYYRGIRIMDLPENQHSQFTYNVLASIKLTEDRTAAEPYWVKAIIESYVTAHAAPDLIKKIVTAPHRSYERSLSFTYNSNPSKEFLDVVESIDEKDESLNSTAIDLKNKYRPPEKYVYSEDWREAFIDALDREDLTKLGELCTEHKNELKNILQKAESSDVYQEVDAVQPEVSEPEGSTHDTEDPIPF